MTDDDGWISQQNKRLSLQLERDEQELQAQGVELTEWGPDPDTGKISIHLTHYTPEAEHVLLDRYGSDAIVVAHESMPLPHRM